MIMVDLLNLNLTRKFGARPSNNVVDGYMSNQFMFYFIVMQVKSIQFVT